MKIKRKIYEKIATHLYEKEITIITAIWNATSPFCSPFPVPTPLH